MIKMEGVLKDMKDFINNSHFVDNFLPYQIYKIDEQTTIEEFAKKYNTSPQNCIYENNFLKAGELVIIRYNPYKIHVVRPAESIETIANKYNKSVEYIKKINNVDKTFVGQQLFI